MSTEAAQTAESLLRFVTPPPGLAPLTEFGLANIGDDLYALRAVEAPDIRLFLLDPRPFFPDYAPRVAEDVLASLGTKDPAVLVVVRPGDGESAPTANLLAPVLVDLESGAAIQVILEGADYPLRAPLTA